MSFVPCILQKDEPARVNILLQIPGVIAKQNHMELHYITSFVPPTGRLHHPYKASFKHTHTAQWNVIITHCIVVANWHTQQLPRSTCQVKHSQDQTVKAQWESKSHGISIWHKESQANTKIPHNDTHTDKGFNNTLISHERSCFFSSHSIERQFTSSCQPTLHKGPVILSLSFSPRATAYVSLSANTPPFQTVYHDLSRLSVILSMPVGTFISPRNLSRPPTAISKTGATLIESFSLSDLTRSWVSYPHDSYTYRSAKWPTVGGVLWTSWTV